MINRREQDYASRYIGKSQWKMLQDCILESNVLSKDFIAKPSSGKFQSIFYYKILERYCHFLTDSWKPRCFKLRSINSFGIISLGYSSVLKPENTSERERNDRVRLYEEFDD